MSFSILLSIVQLVGILFGPRSWGRFS
jgi:hypothetical protein